MTIVVRYLYWKGEEYHRRRVRARKRDHSWQPLPFMAGEGDNGVGVLERPRNDKLGTSRTRTDSEGEERTPENGRTEQ